MESYIIFAIISVFGAGLSNFIFKVIAYKNYNSGKIVVYTYFGATIIAFFVFLFRGQYVGNIFLLFILAFIARIFFTAVMITRIESLKYIDSAIYFPIHKTVGPVLITILSIFVFQENLNFYEWIGVILGIVTSMLLISKKENQRQTNLKKGLILLGWGILLSTLGVWVSKIAYIYSNSNIEFFVLISMLFGFFMGILFFQKNKKKTDTLFKTINKQEFFWGIINAIFLFMSLYFFMSSLKGNLAIVFTINSFSILITVLLSVIFFKEHFNFRKALAVVASILAGIFFVK